MTNPPQSEFPTDLSVRTVLRWVCACLESTGIDSPAAESRLLVAALLHCAPAQLILRSDTQLTTAQKDTLEGWVQRRMSREPVQHILGEAPFLDFSVAVGEGVFIPRPETELLADWAIKAAHQQMSMSSAQPLHILDLCAGSGVLAIAMARAFPTAYIWAVEYSDQAFMYLRRNVAALAPQISLIQGDATLPYSGWGIPENSIDVVVCNPPYVPLDSTVDRETREFDPTDAVFSGEGGLVLSRHILHHLPVLLTPGAVLGMEHDDATGESLTQLAQRAGYSDCKDHLDLAGRPRFMTAHWKSPLSSERISV